LAKTPRKWTGARTPSGLKRVRTSERRHVVLGPRRTAAKTLVKAALAAVAAPGEGADPAEALAAAQSALDRAARLGAIHPNAAARRKSRLALKMNAALGGTVLAAGHVAKTVGRSASQKAARARIASARADKAKGAQTAAGKARAALSKTARAEASAASTAAPAATASPKKAVPPKKAVTPKKAASKVAPKAGATVAAKSDPEAKPAKAAKAEAAPAKKASPKR